VGEVERVGVLVPYRIGPLLWDQLLFRKLQEYQEWAFSSRPGNRARKNATVPASRIRRDAARRGQLSSFK
jgi:hypothetical protein